ncbi:ABC transporter permease [Gorillibacterium massiliense]|uniref:ABC transporter permease n=1 Tax=Gorillibacterium massiliense TaxID=1280390 RepID=UPI0004B7D7C4|nr:ABC transporter permease [Gorillibacterium massiliense]
MASLISLVRNETVKMLKKRRFYVVLLILAILIPIFVYAQMRMTASSRALMGDVDWRYKVTKEMTDLSARINGNMPEEWKKYSRIEIQRLEVALEKNVDPNSPNGVTFTVMFLKNAVSLFLPLLVVIVASDIVSSEQSTGTIKLLLTRPVRRWKILMSKLLALLLFVSLVILAVIVLSYLISGMFFGYKGWQAPVLTGFQVVGDQLISTKVHMIDQWQFLLMAAGLAWFSCLVVACLTLMVSVLVRSTAAGMGIMLSALIAGAILTNMVSSWESAKYLFMINLDTVTYLSGDPPPVPGLNLGFSLFVLFFWAAAGLAVAFTTFTKRDMLG